MSRMTVVKKAAEEMYLAGWKQSDIALAAKVSENTISKWAQKHQWKQKRVKLNVLQQNSFENMLFAYDYEAMCLRKAAEIKIDQDDWTGLGNGRWDAINKGHKNIETPNRDFKAYTIIIRQFLDFIQSEDIELAKSIEPLSRAFVMSKKGLL